LVWFGRKENSLETIAISDDEKDHLQQEYSELSEQLELIMQIYDESRNRRAGPLQDFWTWWWERMDMILPRIVPVPHNAKFPDARITYPTSEECDIIQKETLRQSGNEGLDFTEIIRRHFTEFLPADSHLGGSSLMPKTTIIQAS